MLKLETSFLNLPDLSYEKSRMSFTKKFKSLDDDIYIFVDSDCSFWSLLSLFFRGLSVFLVRYVLIKSVIFSLI